MTTRRGTLKVLLDGRGPLTLRETDYVTSGGEGAIYRSGQTVIKIYADADKMRRDGMPEKIEALAKLQHAGIVAPQGVALDDKRSPIGFYMPFVDGEPLSRVIVSDFRARTGFGDRDAVAVADSMHEIVQVAHRNGALLVDANELNWLVDVTKGARPTAKVIDVDSWEIGRWPATVIMPSIRDWNAKRFTTATDWFAWGVVTFQVFTGIHPYKGRLDGYKPGDLVKRMTDNASVFAPGVRLPHSVRDYSCIPGPLLDWFQATFQQGVRAEPPSPSDTTKPAKAARVLRAVTTATGKLIFEKLFERPGDPVVRVWANGAIRLASGRVMEMQTGRRLLSESSPETEVVKASPGWLLTVKEGGADLIYHVSENFNEITRRTFALDGSRFFRAGEKLFSVTRQKLVEIECRILGQPQITVGRRWNMPVNSTAWFDDVAVIDALGAAFVAIPHDDSLSQVRVRELDGLNVVAAKAGGRFAAFAVLEKTGDFRKIEITFDKTFTTYQAWTGPADSAELNMGILPRGVVGTIVEDGELVIVVPTTGETRKISDRSITTAMKLAAWGEKLVYIADGAAWQVRVA